MYWKYVYGFVLGNNVALALQHGGGWWLVVAVMLAVIGSDIWHDRKQAR